MNNRIIIFGGDGFIGWPTSLYLSNNGYEITIVDNFSRRKIDEELQCESLTPIRDIYERIEFWKIITGKEIKFVKLDISKSYKNVLSLINTIRPKAILHFAEQRSAPYSMKSSTHKRYTVNNNINATNNLLCSIVESGLDIHVVHIGTTGVYGYETADLEIPEGYLTVKVKTDKNSEKEMEIMYPPNAGSIYHMTKVQDAMMFAYYNKNDKIRITDLHQGVVWGTQTKETEYDEILINRFDYDGDYGTVLNRFLMQSQVNHPITIYGTGGQTRAFIHIENSVECIKLAIENPPAFGEKVKIFNQTTECLNILDLAKKIQMLTNCSIKYYRNPRNEDAQNDLKFNNKEFMKLGLNPIKLDDGLLKEIMNIAFKYKDRCKLEKIICTSVWKKNIPIDFYGSSSPIED